MAGSGEDFVVIDATTGVPEFKTRRYKSFVPKALNEQAARRIKRAMNCRLERRAAGLYEMT
jgi:hypothetical protein